MIAGTAPPKRLSPFDKALGALVSAELPIARRSPERLDRMVERLTFSLAMVIVFGYGGDSAQAGALIDGAQNYLDETVATLRPIGGLVVQNRAGAVAQVVEIETIRRRARLERRSRR